ncbi:glutaminase liver isoform, mitochondrial isoform X2 [Folsomia candida]|uniref:glutaminase liver isoform, mitochondrial isoform X2 n=1 Tax=Folsomia candida TaxID=158441 RepID=UPI000B8FF6B4|nr:glutaminase liver isoform, mitochondrial isoform X2 [Folsomia candida]
MFGQGIRHFRAIQACGGASGGLSYLGGGSADQRLISFLAASTQSNVLSSSQHRGKQLTIARNWSSKTKQESKQAKEFQLAASQPLVEGSREQPHRNVDDLIFDMFQDKDADVVLVGNLLAALEKTGLRRSDPRLLELFENLKRVHAEQEKAFPKKNIGSIETLTLDRETFKTVITDNIVLISRAFRQQFIIPEFQQFCKTIEEMFIKMKSVTGGKVAQYIPQLARMDKNYWAVSICSIDGQRHSIGQTTIPFTLQSCSKPLTYAIALNELGSETVHQYVGQEPSGRMFNELVLDYNKKPHNPMVNAGAIIVCSLLKTMVRPELTLAEKFDYTLQYFKRMGGGEYVGFNNSTFLSERECADRNYALGFYMREHKCFPEGTNLKECLDYYFQCCSMETNCETTAVMAATLANGGICPISGEKVLKSDSVRDVLSLMHSCGMYDYSGQFAFKVGLPAKSGVSGCIILVVPNVLGMCIWSPPLDVLGNTFRGVAFCQELVEIFNFHKYDNLRHASHKLDPRRHRYETKGLNIVNLLFSAASGDVTSMRRHHLSGMDMSAGDYDGRTALHLAAAEGHLECVEYLLRHCHVSHKPLDRWGHLPLDDAERFGHEDVSAFLKQWNTDNPSV